MAFSSDVLNNGSSQKNNVPFSNALIMLVGLKDNLGKVIYPACNSTCIENIMWGKDGVNSVLLDSSGGTTSINNIKYGSLIMNVPLMDESLTQLECHMGDVWFHKVVNYTKAKGIDVTLYAPRIYVFSQDVGMGMCQNAGFSNMGCSVAECSIWVRAFNTRLILHELGHLLGLNHAQLDNTAINPGSTVKISEDPSDLMSSSGPIVRYNPVQRFSLGWINLNETVVLNLKNITKPVNITIASVSELGLSYDVSGFGSASVSKVLPILIHIPINASVSLFVSWRYANQKTSDIGFLSFPSLNNKVYLHQYFWKEKISRCLNIIKTNDTSFNAPLLNTEFTMKIIKNDTSYITFKFQKCVRGSPPKLEQYPSLGLKLKSFDTGCATQKYVAVGLSPNTNSSLFNCHTIRVDRVQDNSPAENSFVVTSSNGSVLMNIIGVVKSSSIYYCGIAGELINVTMIDSYGDGYCCDWGPGSYSIYFDGYLVKTGGKFGFSETTILVNAVMWDFTNLNNIAFPRGLAKSTVSFPVSALVEIRGHDMENSLNRVNVTWNK